MRIDVKTKHDRDTKESRYQKIFERKFRKLMMKEYGYSELNREKVERVIAEHIKGGKVVEEYTYAKNV